MRLDASGNLGLGVTPSAWTVFKVLQSQRSAFASYSDGSPNAATVVSTNAFYDGSWKYIESIAAASYEQATSPSAAHKWFVAPTGTAGNTITFTQAMTLDASGNLGVGTTSPGYRLDVSGDIRAVTTGTTRYIIAGSDTQGAVFQQRAQASWGDAFQVYRAGNLKWALQEGGDAFIVSVNSAERARITSGGYFKASDAGTYAGSTGNYHEFRTSASTRSPTIQNTHATQPFGILIEYTAAAPNGAGNDFVYCSDNAAARAVIRSNGGLANYQANNVDLSDARTKTDITPAASMWDKVAALEIVAYKYIDQTHDDVNLGVIAQQVETVEPVWVDADGFGETPEGEEPFKTVYTKDITFAAIKALQEAMARIEALEARLEALEA